MSWHGLQPGLASMARTSADEFAGAFYKPAAVGDTASGHLVPEDISTNPSKKEQDVVGDSRKQQCQHLMRTLTTAMTLTPSTPLSQACLRKSTRIQLCMSTE